MEKSNNINPGVYLCSLKQKISETMKGMSELGIDNQSLNNSLKDALKKVDSVVYSDIKKALVEKFGEWKWSIKVDNYIIPTLAKGRRNDYKYIIKNISWVSGPSIHEVHYFIVERFLYYLTSKEYDSKIYTRNIPGIEKRYSSLFTPMPINGKEFQPIEVFISRIIHRISEKEVKQFYKLEVTDSKYKVNRKFYDEQKHQNIVEQVPIVQNINAKTKEGLFLKLQENLEGVFYMRENTPENRENYKQLMKNQIIQISAEPPLVRPSSGGGGGGDPEHDEEGQGLAGTDETDVYDDASIPTEEPNFDEGGLPPTPESIDHNYHDDSNPEIMEKFEEESGHTPAEDKEEAGEDPAEEATETPEEEAAEEASEPPESSEEASLSGGGSGSRTSGGNSISDLMEYDHKQNMQPVELTIRSG
jgi:hypothetical protein